MKKSTLATSILFVVSIILFSLKNDELFIDYTINKVDKSLVLVWKDSTNKPFLTFSKLKTFLDYKDKKLAFAMNGGMYMQNSAPLGLYIENGQVLSKLNVRNAKGNFYLKPNGVFYITKKNEAKITATEQMDKSSFSDIRYATQSGPMLLINGKVHKAFNKGSKNLNIRNGAGILPKGGVVFSMSSKPVNLYDFAMHFKALGCKNALYLDGYVSKMYYPAKNLKGNKNDKFGVMVAIVK